MLNNDWLLPILDITCRHCFVKHIELPMPIILNQLEIVIYNDSLCF